MEQLIVAGLRVAFVCYMVLALVHSILQHWYAYKSAQHEDDPEAAEPSPPWLPSVDVVVPCYNEASNLLEECCASLAHQDYEGELQVWLVDDGSANREELLSVYERYSALPGWHSVLLDEHLGKRKAQDAAFSRSAGELVITIDSDTSIAPEGIRSIVSALRDERVGAATGNVAALNARTNLLTRVLNDRYSILFGQERAAQSFVDSVLCCSGPFSAYRRSALEGLWPEYLGQTLRGVPCVAGDDLHLTNLMLARGYGTRYERRAMALTSVPTTLREYVRQQVRWNRSFYRELAWTVPILLGRHAYLAIDVVARTLLPLLLCLALLLAGGELLLVGPGWFVHDVNLIGAMILVHALFIIWQTHSPQFFLVYGILFVVLLLPIRLHALLTLTCDQWGTRQ
jgi:N-acetylglucosaminyltransferase